MSHPRIFLPLCCPVILNDGIGLHLDKNRNGLYDSGDNLIGLLDGITTVPSRLIRLPAG